MKQYLEGLQYILDHGTDVSDRTGVGTRSVFGYNMRFDLNDGFPAVTTKKLAWKSVVSELLWFLEGSIDERRLAEITYDKPREELIGKTTIWTANADAQGKALGYINTDIRKDLGPVYGFQWRNFNGHSDAAGMDQIAWLANEMKVNPDSRRLLLSAWNPSYTHKMTLPPCHVSSQYRIVNGKLSCLMYQRSSDVMLGTPFNVASYALLTHVFASHVGLEVGDLIVSNGDFHIYQNHMNQVKEQLTRTPTKLPTLTLPKIESFDIDYIRTLNVNDFILNNYVHQDAIKAPMAV